MGTSKSLKYNIAYLISRIFGPLSMACILWLVIALRSGIGFWKAVWVYPLIFITTIALPTLVTSYLVASKLVSSIEWPNIDERKKYLPPIALITTFVLCTLTYILTNSTIFHLSLLFSLIVFLELFVWSFFNFKISAHISAVIITVMGINLFYHQQFLWLFALVIPIIWARSVLKMHTLTQLIAGFLLSFGVLMLAIYLFGWPAIP